MKSITILFLSILFSLQNIAQPVPPGKLPDTRDPKSEIPKISIQELKKIAVHRLLRLDEGTFISGFIFTIDLPDGSIRSVPNNSDKFNDATRSLINNARPGNLITIDQIKIMAEGVEKKKPSVFYELTE